MELFTKQSLLEAIEHECGLQIGDLCKFSKDAFKPLHNDRYTVLNNRISIFIDVYVRTFQDNQLMQSWHNNDTSLVFYLKI